MSLGQFQLPAADHQIGGIMPLRGILGEVVAALGRRIVGGEWQEGDALPTEAELTASFAVSRSVIREATRILNAKGLVHSRQKHGTTVMARRSWRLLDPDLIQWRMQAGDRSDLLRDLLQVRLALEPGVVWIATAHGSAEAKARIDAAFANQLASRNAPTPQQRASFIVADLEFHRAFLMAVGSEILEQLFSVIEAALALMFDVQLRAQGSTVELVGIEETTRQHREVYDAFCANDADGAEAAMRRLIQSAIQDAKKGFSLPD